MNSTALSTPFLALFLVSVAGAQASIYADVGSAILGAGTPGPTHAGAAPAAGVWNEIDSDLFATLATYTTPPLNNTMGAATGVTIEFDALGLDFLAFEADEMYTFGDDAALLDDAIYVQAPWEMRVSGLSAGTYDVIVYAMAPDSPVFLTSVAVVGSSDPSQDIGGDFAAGYVLGTTHSLHTITITAGGVITIEIDVADTNDTVSGIQIFPSGSAGGVGLNYCGPAVPNSSGGPAEMWGTGSALVSANDLTLTCTDMPLNAFGYFLTSQDQGNVPTAGTSIGTLCLGGAIGRFIGAGQIQNSGTGGSIILTINLAQTPQPTGIVAIVVGESWSFQAWFRDTDGMGGLTSNFSDGYVILFL